ncbi:hypothetical protein F383_39263 [Gossypium arboreum]|uniref:Uncharacterized protein n=1 Tax=Gossypium arboreum TaxID=29729 RepID=A0A0B0MLA0_GOSAR|nr:hypothetical protein F383_39263 [Gossypium arboreum]
MSLKYVIV